MYCLMERVYFLFFLQLFLQQFGADGETTRTFSTHHNKKKKVAEKMHPQANKGAHTSARQSPPLQNQAAAKTPSIISLQITVTHLDGLALVQWWWWWWVEGGGLHWQMGAWSLSGIWVQRHSMRPPQSIALAARPLERASVSSGERRGGEKKKSTEEPKISGEPEDTEADTERCECEPSPW